MKHLLLILITTFTLFAEATFDQVQSMIDKQQYKQAVLALTIIDANHPNSSKVQYALAQAQAGLGNLPAAREALDKAQAINPKLDFVPVSQVAALTQAITPQTKLVTKVESESHWFLWTLLISSIAGVIWYFRPKPKLVVKPTPSAEPKPDSKPYSSPTEPTYTPPRYSSDYTSTSNLDHQARSSRPSTTEVHHHHHSDNTVSTIITAGLTAAAVSTLMDDDKPTYEPTHSYEPETTSSSWDDTSSDSLISNSWNEPSSSSSNWDDSSSSDSWSSSSDSSSSSSSWND